MSEASNLVSNVFEDLFKTISDNEKGTPNEGDIGNMNPFLNKKNTDAEKNEAAEPTQVKASRRYKRSYVINYESDMENEEAGPIPVKASGRNTRRMSVINYKEVSDDENVGSFPVKKKKTTASDDRFTQKKSTLNMPKMQSKTPTVGNKVARRERNQTEFLMTPMKQTAAIDNQIAKRDIWLHNRAEFIKLLKIRLNKAESPEPLNYECKTLYISSDLFNKQTPTLAQWWNIKRDHTDSLLLFNLGKFYELYHMDAVIGVQVFGVKFEKTEWGRLRFTKTAYVHMLHYLMLHNYKVARVEQREKHEMAAERKKTTGKRKWFYHS